ncbi:hypothetical protein C8J57DRAFT_1355705, partial [Mycena rebaudengoi]
MWFGPSAAAGAVRTLVDASPACGLGVSVATDGTLYQTEVYAVSHTPLIFACLVVARRTCQLLFACVARLLSEHLLLCELQTGGDDKAVGRPPVLLLLGIRLGLDGVNPEYYETIKMLYTFPQSVGIAGGRPSSSYYFVG